MMASPTRRVFSLLTAFLLAASFIAVTSEPVQASPDPGWLSGWEDGWRMKITVDYTKVDADLDNFPVLVYLDSTYTDFWSHCDSEQNIAFTLSDGTTKLKREIELFDHTNDNLYAHVKVPDLSSTVDTDIYIYYDSASHGQTNDADTWDDNFVMVQHMDDYTTSSILDSTSYNNDGTKKAVNEPIECDGKIGKAQDFDGEDDYIDTTDISEMNNASELTVSMYIKPEAIDVTSRLYFKRKDTDNEFQAYTHSNGNMYITSEKGGTGYIYFDYSTKFTAGAWHNLVVVFDGGLSGNTNRLKLYVNGELISMSDAGTIQSTIADMSGYNLYVGGPSDIFNGIIDEIRISNTARSAAWIKTTFNNQSDPASFYSVGSEETANVAPNKPTNLQPTGVQTTTSVGISCVGTDNDGDDMNVHFYDNSDNSLIDNIWIENGQTAQVTWDGLAHGQMYVFFAGAQDNNGKWGENSDTQSFWVILHGPELYKPIENQPYFEWSDLYADNYRLLIDNDQEFSPPIENRVLTENHYQIPPENALDNGVWYWKVIAYFDGEEAESDVWSFVVGNPGIQVSLLCYSEVQGGENQDFKVHVRDLEGNLVDADSAQLSLYDPNSNLILDNVSMGREETGIYVLVFNTGGYPTGEWLAVAWVQKGPLAAEDRVYWRLVQAGPFGISIVGYPDLTAPIITFELEIHNEGDIKVDATVEWWIDDAGSNRVDEGVLTKAVDPGGKWYPKIDADVGSEGDYTLYSRVWWEETEHAEAEGLFTAVSGAPPPSPIFFFPRAPEKYDVTIQVSTVEDLPLENSTVYVDDMVATTGAWGTTKLELEEGTYTIRVVKIGYETESMTVVVDEDRWLQFFLEELKPWHVDAWDKVREFLEENWMWIALAVVPMLIILDEYSARKGRIR